MKKLTIALVILLAANTVDAKNLKALFDYKTFYAPEQGTYIETYLSVIGTSVNYKQNESGNYVASVEVTMTIKDATGVKFTDKYNLLSPVVTDTLQPLNFVDHHRMQLANGNYTVELSLTDKNGDGKPFTASILAKVEYFPNLVSVSDIEFAESFTKSQKESVLAKNGYDVVPLVDNYFPAKSDKLNFYAEVYNTSKVLGSEPLLINYYIQNFENKKIIDNYSVVQRKTSAEVIPLMSTINIADLPSGNYQIVINVKNKNNDLLASKDIFFQRTSANTTANNAAFINGFVDRYSDKKILAEDIACLQPISNAMESEYINTQLKLADFDMMKNFFFDFWHKRDAANPETAWLQYKNEVDIVQKSYGTKVLRGYNTDLGRVYLQYGQPNTISRGENEPTAYPYEIWHYDKIKNFTNKTFVFYNKDLIGKNYILLHSDMPGEVSDSQWNFKLHGRTMHAESYDDEIKKVNLSGDKTQENFNTK